MQAETHFELSSLIESVNSSLDDYDTVSLDLFDTLFIRRIHEPDEIKRPVAIFISNVARQYGIDISFSRTWQIRNEIEQQHRNRNGKHFPDFEARYEDFMKEVLSDIFEKQVPTGFLEEVIAYELRIETSMLVVREEFARWLKYLKEQKKRVLIISDIYHSSSFLELLIREKGLDPYIHSVISSADSFNAKASGSAWPLVRDRFNLDINRWVHIGDNPISDSAKPEEFGIKAHLLRDLGEKHRKSIVRHLHAKSSRNELLKGRYVQQLMLPLEAENVDVSPLYTDGYNFMGPLLGYFCLSVLDYCRTNKIDRVYFCSREGWTLLRCWDEMMPILAPDGNYPEASYLYVSRIALAKASCSKHGLSNLSAGVALLPANSRDFRDICRVFSLDIEPILPFLEMHDLSAHDPIGHSSPGVTIENRHKFQELLLDSGFQNEVKRQARPAQLKLESYLNQEGFFEHPDVALIDIGWLGTIQHYLVDAISHRLHKPRIHGMLLGASKLMPYRDNHESRVHGVLYDRLRFSFPESLVTTIKDVFEETCRAPHPSVIDYERKYSSVEPIFRNTDDEVAFAEEEQDRHYAPLRQGIFDSAARFAVAMAVTGYRTQHLKPWLNLLLTARIAFPKTAEVSRIKHQVHQDDFAGNHIIPKKILRATRNLWDVSLRQLRFNPFLRLYYYLLHALRLLRSG